MSLFVAPDLDNCFSVDYADLGFIVGICWPAACWPHCHISLAALNDHLQARRGLTQLDNQTEG